MFYACGNRAGSNLPLTLASTSPSAPFGLALILRRAAADSVSPGYQYSHQQSLEFSIKASSPAPSSQQVEDRCVVERKDLPDLIYSFTSERPAFVHRLRVMSQYPHRLLVITTALCQVKSLQPHGGGSAGRNPFAVCHRKACAVRSAGWRKPGGDGLDARIGCQRPRPAGISGA